MADHSEESTVTEHVEEKPRGSASSSSSSDSDSDGKKPEPAPAVAAKVYRLFGREKPVHHVLGGGKPANILLWRDKKISAGVLAGATLIWVLFELVGYHLLTFVCHGLELSLILLFLWSKTFIFINKSRPRIPEVWISEEQCVKVAVTLTYEINKAFAVLREVALGRGLKKFLAVIAGLWLLSIVGSSVNFLSLLYILFVTLHTVPVLYEKYDDKVHAYAERVMAEIKKQYAVSWNPSSSQLLSITDGLSKRSFTYEELVTSTNNFSEANLLGEGGFSYVYKGMLTDGTEVAIKRLKVTRRPTDLEFMKEANILSLVHHRNLVSLIGFCIYKQNWILVCEYVPNKTLEFHLHGTNRPTLAWTDRYEISLETARGLAYLHEDCQPRIIHRDVKAANILLDHSFRAKIADFGIAKHFSDDKTHVSTIVKGTYGYLDPEYLSTGQITDKSDVYSYGVVLLELITGKKPAALVDWIVRALEGYTSLGDQTLRVPNRSLPIDSL